MNGFREEMEMAPKRKKPEEPAKKPRGAGQERGKLVVDSEEVDEHVYRKSVDEVFGKQRTKKPKPDKLN